MNRNIKHIVKKSISILLVLLIVNLNLNALYQTTLLNPDSSCHTKTVETSCCEMEMEKMTEAECSLTKWLGNHQISSCTCLHELNEVSSVIINSGNSVKNLQVKSANYIYADTENNTDYIKIHHSENYKLNTTRIYLFDSAFLI